MSENIWKEERVEMPLETIEGEKSILQEQHEQLLEVYNMYAGINEERDGF